MASQYPKIVTLDFVHPTLGSLTGTISPVNVVQFRAIPYATIPARFKRSILLTDLSGIENRDFTKPGFACPQRVARNEVNGGLFPGEVFPHPQDEFKCLILEINVPLATLQEPNRENVRELPVMVYIHGGGFVLGKIDEQHTTKYMVEQSLQQDQHVIGVSLQYRLGALGNLRTPDESEINLALRDQRNALLWIQKFISGFGGDAKRVTVFGESAGSISICYHMLSDVPLFKRVVLMSGLISAMSAPRPREVAERMYERLLEVLGIEERGEEGLEQLRKVDVGKLVEGSEKVNQEGDMWFPLDDEDWFGDRGVVTWDRVPELLGKCEWVEDVMIGVTGFEGATQFDNAKALTPKTFTESITKQLGQENSKRLLDVYKVTPEMDENLFLTSAMRWIGDVIFDAPNHFVANYLSKSTKRNIYRYNFDIRNPFPAQPYYQISHHWVDVYFVFKTFQFRYPSQRLKDISTQHAKLWVDFANGIPPWEKYDVSKGTKAVVMVADERDGWVERTMEEDEAIADRDLKRLDVLIDVYSTTHKGEYFYPIKIGPLENSTLV